MAGRNDPGNKKLQALIKGKPPNTEQRKLLIECDLLGFWWVTHENEIYVFAYNLATKKRVIISKGKRAIVRD